MICMHFCEGHWYQQRWRDDVWGQSDDLMRDGRISGQIVRGGRRRGLEEQRLVSVALGHDILQIHMDIVCTVSWSSADLLTHVLQLMGDCLHLYSTFLLYNIISHSYADGGRAAKEVLVSRGTGTHGVSYQMVTRFILQINNNDIVQRLLEFVFTNCHLSQTSRWSYQQIYNVQWTETLFFIHTFLFYRV